MKSNNILGIVGLCCIAMECSSEKEGSVPKSLSGIYPQLAYYM